MVVYSSFGAGNSLQCYQCVYAESNSDIDLLKGITVQFNAQCRSPIPGSVPSTTCSADEKCGAIKIKGSVDILRSFSAEVVVRDCLRAVNNGCGKLDGDLPKENGFLIDTKINEVSGCWCDWDLCDTTSTCGSDSVSVGSLCVEMWIVLIGALVVLLFLITCCCYCCCRCCRRKTVSRGFIIPNVCEPTVARASSTKFSV